MRSKGIFIGNGKLQSEEVNVCSGIESIRGEEFYLIRNFDRMSPFLMTVVSSSDHWMYISSTGGLTAGRVNPDQAIFPYYTDDKIHDSSSNTGPRTLIHCYGEEGDQLWEPFSACTGRLYSIQRTLFKNIPGNKVIFEEINHDLGLQFRYSWMSSDKFGWVRQSELINISGKSIRMEILDGLLNILPFGIIRQTQAQFSTLMDAYKKNEVVDGLNLALFRMSSIPVDRAEPSEALSVTTAWSHGLLNPKILLGTKQLEDFRNGRGLIPEKSNRGVRGAFLLNSSLELSSGEAGNWSIVLNCRQDISDVHTLINRLSKPGELMNDVYRDVEHGTDMLIRIVKSCDGLQNCADKLVSGRHFSNVMFNVMRGGYFRDDYSTDRKDFINHVRKFNKSSLPDIESWVKSFPEPLEYNKLLEYAQLSNNPLIYRLVLEYLPLTFSRRHGDPSRPWNVFSINIKNDDGSQALGYQGNWRDIFQNWEALAMSYPCFIHGMIAKFLNASTIDGYNPYRINDEGFDWEIHDASDPWSNIGYWGDHQIIYLLKLLEIAEEFFPGSMNPWLNHDIFVYADVPYRIRRFEEIINNPRNSIQFDSERNALLMKRFKETGADGKLLTGKNGKIVYANLAEKLLVSILSKLSNFIPGAGIWMNTQRPDWNDANNALTGFGVSMVTLYHLRRHLLFLVNFFSKTENEDFLLGEEVLMFLKDIQAILDEKQNILDSGQSDKLRKDVTFRLGMAGSRYREEVYSGIKGEKRSIRKIDLLNFLQLALGVVDGTIGENRRADGLYHSYNLISIDETGIRIRHLYEMLEGQVSLLGSGYASAEEALLILNSLRKSRMYREDQQSYTLYPDRELPLFLEKNLIPDDLWRRSEFLTSQVLEKKIEIVKEDESGKVHFNSRFNNASTLESALEEYELDLEEKKLVISIYETVFDHQSFTGRSGTFFKYEGLGCIYWHMVSKLLLAVGEIITRSAKQGIKDEVLNQLKEHYYQIRLGIGLHKNPVDYGAFTTDPYSHTPAMMGVQQPGMTGQVKEDILCRLMELGIFLQKGQIMIQPLLLREDEFIRSSQEGTFEKSALIFSFCGIPFEYVQSEKTGINVYYSQGKEKHFSENTLDLETSREIAMRSGKVSKVRVMITLPLIKHT